MKIAKKMIGLLLIVAFVVGFSTSLEIEVYASSSIASPDITVRTVKKGTGVKVNIAETKDAEGFYVEINGRASRNLKEYSDYILVNGRTQRTENISVTEHIENDGKVARSITVKYLPEGTYTVKVRSYNNKKFGTLTYSEYSKEKKFTLKKQVVKESVLSYDFSKVKEGDIIKFGSYEQDLDYTNGKEPIEWIVLKKNKKEMLVVSKFLLDILPYNKEFKDVTWETCTLRKWLNNEFISNAFNKNEKAKVKTVTVENLDNAVYQTIGGKNTKDKVFLLSQLEMIDTEMGFADNYDSFDIKRRAAYAWNKGKMGSSYPTEDGESATLWWLRSPGRDADYGCVVCYDGGVYSYGRVSYSVGIRPALYIKL